MSGKAAPMVTSASGIQASMLNSSDSDSFSKTIYIHWPSSPFKTSLVINHTTSIFLTLTEIMDNVTRVENIDFSKFRLFISKDGQDLPLDMEKTLSEYPTDEFILRPVKVEKELASSSDHPSQATSRRRSSILEAPGTKLTQVRTANEFNVYFQRMINLNNGAFDDTNSEEIYNVFPQSPAFGEDPKTEPGKLYTIASQSFDAISKSSLRSVNTESGTDLKQSHSNLKGSDFNLAGSQLSLSDLKSSSNTKSAINIKIDSTNGSLKEDDSSVVANISTASDEVNIESVMAEGSISIPTSIAESPLKEPNYNYNSSKSKRNRSATLKKAEIRTRVHSEIINTDTVSKKPQSSETMYSTNEEPDSLSIEPQSTTSMKGALSSDFEATIEKSPLPKTLLKVSLPHQMTTTMVKVPEKIVMEDLLRYLAWKRKFNFEDFTLAIPKNLLVANTQSLASPSAAATLTPTAGSSSSDQNNLLKEKSTVKGNIWGSLKFGPLSVGGNSNNSSNAIALTENTDSTTYSQSSTIGGVPINLPPPNVVNPTPSNIDSNLVEVELDRNLLYYRDTMDAKEVVVVSSAKSYSVVCISENNQDVMLLQMIRGLLQVVAATEAKLIEKLTDDQEQDLTYMNNFLLTFRNFTVPERVLETLLDRFNVVPPPNPTAEDLEFFKCHKEPTQLKVLDVIFWWTEYYWHDFSINKMLREELLEFIDQCAKCGPAYEERCARIRASFENNLVRYKSIQELKRKSQVNKGKSVRSIFLELEPETIAKQMSLLCFRLFNHIHTIEFLNQIWKPSSKGVEVDDLGESNDPSPNLTYFISRFDLETYWTATEICMEKDLKRRTKVLKNFILLCQENRNLNNFFSVFSILGGLNLGPVQRLKKTWEGLSARVKAIYDGLEKISDPSRNMKAVREAIASSKPPMIPLLAIYLKDLTFMNDGNPSKIEGMINFAKLRMMGQRVMELAELNRCAYPFTENPSIQNYLRKPPVEFTLAKLKEASIACEPPQQS